MSDESMSFDAAWFIKAFGGYLAVSFFYGAIGLIFGWGAALVCGLITLAYLVGFLHGAGTEIMKRDAAKP